MVKTSPLADVYKITKYNFYNKSNAIPVNISCLGNSLLRKLGLNISVVTRKLL